MDVKDRLAKALRAAGCEGMAQAAGRGYYGDFTSPIAAPKVTLVYELRAMKTAPASALADRVIAGDFDD